MAISKIHPLALGITAGVLSGLGTFAAGMLAVIFYTGKPIVGMMGAMYITYSPSVINSAIGGGVVLVNAFIGAYIAAWVYNFLIARM